MMSRSVPNCSIGGGFASGHDGRTVNDEIVGTHEPGMQGLLHTENEERFMQRGSCRLTAFALLRGTGNVPLSVEIRGQATIQSQAVK